MAPTTCSRCGALVRSPADQVEVRVEYRAASSLRRLRTWRMRVVCRGCAMDEWMAHDFPNGQRAAEQGTLQI